MDSGISRYFLFSGFGKKTVTDLQQMINDLGGICIDSKIFSESCTHIICAKPNTDEIFLSACITGKWILIPKYVQDSIQHGKWLNEMKYEWSQEFATDITSSFISAIYNAPKMYRLTVHETNKKIFTDWKVYLSIDNKCKCNKYNRLLKLGGAEVIKFATDESIITHVFFEGILVQLPIFKCQTYLCLRPEYIDHHIIMQDDTPPEQFLITVPYTEFPLSDHLIKSSINSITYSSEENVVNEKLSNCLIEYQKPNEVKNILEISDPETSGYFGNISINNSSNLQLALVNNLSSEIEISSDTEEIISSSFYEERNINMHNIDLDDDDDDDCYIIYENFDTHKFSEVSNNIEVSTVERSPSKMELLSSVESSDIKIPSKIKIEPNESRTKKRQKSSNFEKSIQIINEKSKSLKMLPKVDHKQKKITLYFPTKSTSPHSVVKSENLVDNNESSDSREFSTATKFRILNGKEEFENNYTANELTYKDSNNIKEPAAIYKPEINCNIAEFLTNNENYCDDKIKSNEVSSDMTALFNVSIEENDKNTALEMIECLVTKSYYPQSKTLNTLMFHILECSDDENIVNKALIILHRIFHLHPPVNKVLSQYYLDSFSLCGEESVPSWYVLATIIKKRIQLKNSGSDKLTINTQYLLDFMVDVIEYNFSSFLSRNKNIREEFRSAFRKDLPIAVKMFWSSGELGVVNKECKELFYYLSEFMEGEDLPDTIFKPLLSLQKLIGIIAQCCVLSDSKIQYDECKSIRAQSFVISIFSTLSFILRENNDMLQLFLLTTQLPWMKLLFCKMFLDEDTICPPDILSKTTQFSLQMIVENYMHRIPSCEKKYSLRSFIKKPETPKKLEKPLDTTMKSSVKESPVTKRNLKDESKRVNLFAASFDDEITPLHEAVRRNRVDIAKLLLERGGVQLLKARTKHGYTAFNFKCSEEMTNLLTSYSHLYMENCQENLHLPNPFERKNEGEQSTNNSTYDRDLHKYLLLLYNMTASYLVVYQIDEILHEYKKSRESEEQVSSKTFFDTDLMKKSVASVLKTRRNICSSGEESSGTKELRFALELPNVVEEFKRRLDIRPIHPKCNVILMAFDFLAIKYKMS